MAGSGQFSSSSPSVDARDSPALGRNRVQLESLSVLAAVFMSRRLRSAHKDRIGFSQEPTEETEILQLRIQVHPGDDRGMGRERSKSSITLLSSKSVFRRGRLPYCCTPYSNRLHHSDEPEFISLLPPFAPVQFPANAATVPSVCGACSRPGSGRACGSPR